MKVMYHEASSFGGFSFKHTSRVGRCGTVNVLLNESSSSNRIFRRFSGRNRRILTNSSERCLGVVPASKESKHRNIQNPHLLFHWHYYRCRGLLGSRGNFEPFKPDFVKSDLQCWLVLVSGRTGQLHHCRYDKCEYYASGLMLGNTGESRFGAGVTVLRHIDTPTETPSYWPGLPGLGPLPGPLSARGI